MAKNAVERFIEEGASVEVSRCLSCTRDTCDNCPWDKKKKSEAHVKGRPRRWINPNCDERYNLDLFLGLYNAGLTTSEIARHMGMSFHSIRNFIDKHGLVQNRKLRKPITKKELEEKYHE